MSLEKAMAEERARLNAEIKVFQDEKANIESKIAGLKKELKAIDAYERAKSGATATTAKRRPGIRNDVLDTIKANPDGISPSDIMEKLGVKGDTAGQRAVSNALQNLKKAGTVISEDGTYKPS